METTEVINKVTEKNTQNNNNNDEVANAKPKEPDSVNASGCNQQQTAGNTSSKPRSSREDKMRKKDDKSVDHVLKALNSLNTTEEKLAAMCKKYADLFDESRKVQLALKSTEKKCCTIQREKEQLQTEHTKAILTRSRLENLCRELQRQNKVIKDESLLKIREEEEKRKEVSGKFQATLNEITALMQQNNDKNMKLRDDNIDMTARLKSVCEQYELREQQVEKINKQMRLETQLADAKLAKAKMEMVADREIMLRDKQQLLLELQQYQARCKEFQGTEINLRNQISMYDDKYDEFQKALARSNEVFAGFKGEMEKMSKKMCKLEKEVSTWKQRWEGSHKALLDMAEEKQKADLELSHSKRQLQTLQNLCRTMQGERTSLLSKLKEQTSENDNTAAGDGATATVVDSSLVDQPCQVKIKSDSGNCTEPALSESITVTATNGDISLISQKQGDIMDKKKPGSSSVQSQIPTSLQPVVSTSPGKGVDKPVAIEKTPDSTELKSAVCPDKAVKEPVSSKEQKTSSGELNAKTIRSDKVLEEEAIVIESQQTSALDLKMTKISSNKTIEEPVASGKQTNSSVELKMTTCPEKAVEIPVATKKQPNSTVELKTMKTDSNKTIEEPVATRIQQNSTVELKKTTCPEKAVESVAAEKQPNSTLELKTETKCLNKAVDEPVACSGKPQNVKTTVTSPNKIKEPVNNKQLEDSTVELKKGEESVVIEKQENSAVALDLTTATCPDKPVEQPLVEVSEEVVNSVITTDKLDVNDTKPVSVCNGSVEEIKTEAPTLQSQTKQKLNDAAAKDVIKESPGKKPTTEVKKGKDSKKKKKNT